MGEYIRKEIGNIKILEICIRAMQRYQKLEKHNLIRIFTSYSRNNV